MPITSDEDNLLDIMLSELVDATTKWGLREQLGTGLVLWILTRTNKLLLEVNSKLTGESVIRFPVGLLVTTRVTWLSTA